jgi:alkylated DNA repair dioxygenase AlkB
MPGARAVLEEPAGLVYRPEFVTPEEERELVGWIEGLELGPVVMHGQAARRTVRHYGYDYDYEARGRVAPGEPMPPELVPLRDRGAELAGLAPEELVQALVTRYPAGAPIGWHRDAPAFGAQIVGVSLESASRMRFQRGEADERRVWELALEPRSAYVLGGPARSEWQHSIPPVPGLRYSITFRPLRVGQARSR